MLTILLVFGIGLFDGVDHFVIAIESSADRKFCRASDRIVIECHVRIIDYIVGNIDTAVLILEIEHAIVVVLAP